MLFSLFSANYAEKTNNISKDLPKQEQFQLKIKNASKVFAVGLLFNLMWTFCCFYSTNLMMDALIYDAAVTFFYTTSLLLVGVAASFSLINYVGIALVMLGIILMKL